VNDIETPRLFLRLVPLAGLEAIIAHDGKGIAREIGSPVPAIWFEEDWLAKMRLEQWQENAAYAPWSIRAIIEKSSGAVVGRLNCHREPMDFIHAEVAKPAVEIGYDIYDAFQRRGFAYEAVTGYFDWAKAQGVPRFVLSISPGNAASNALARKLGAFQIGSQIDEIDGPEDVFLVEW
jgi:RimJ/RimL family protein N-acetyltransferase